MPFASLQTEPRGHGVYGSFVAGIETTGVRGVEPDYVVRSDECCTLHYAPLGWRSNRIACPQAILSCLNMMGQDLILRKSNPRPNRSLAWDPCNSKSAGNRAYTAAAAASATFAAVGDGYYPMTEPRDHVSSVRVGTAPAATAMGGAGSNGLDVISGEGVRGL